MGVVSEWICLRCDWTGGGDGAACPRCGAALYRIPEPTTPPEVTPPPRLQPRPAGDRIPSSPIGTPQSDEGLPPVAPVAAAGRRWAVIVGAFTTLVAVWMVATGGPFGRTQTPAAPPPATGSTVSPASEPALTDLPPPWKQVDLTGLPPEGAVPSTPKTGDVVAQFAENQVGWVYVYADGRVIWYRDGVSMFERRLTPDGVDLVRSGAVRPGELLGYADSPVPASAWADPEIRAYVPARYAVCYVGKHRPLEPSDVVGLLPAPARTLLRGKERTYDPVFESAGDYPPPPDPVVPSAKCSEVTTEEARALDEIFRDAGFEGVPGAIEDSYLFEPRDEVRNWITIFFLATLPHGNWGFCCVPTG